MDEQVKYTEQDLKRARDWRRGGKEVCCDRHLAELIASVRSEAQRAILVRDFSGVICPHCGKAHDIEITGLTTRLVAAEHLHKGLRAILPYREHADFCGVEHTETCTCGLKQIADYARKALAAWKEAAGK